MSTQEAQPHGGVRVVVVDDEELARTVVARRLRQWGFEALTFAEPRHALGFLARGTANAVITDLDMPETDGLAFARALRRLHPHLPVVLMTGCVDPDLHLNARAHGVDALVIKRADFHDELHEALQRALAERACVATSQSPAEATADGDAATATSLGDVELAHALRTPLTALKSAIDILCRGSLPEAEKHLAEIAQRNADQMILVIERLLEHTTAKR